MCLKASSTTMANKGQRGVKASRIKLEQYMSIAGIKSQAELARKIADNEELDSEPKDLVNRVFRQKNVEHHSLERVAKALSVEAFKLYLTQTDQAILADSHMACMPQDTENSSSYSSVLNKAVPETSTEMNNNRTNKGWQKSVIITFTFILVVIVACYSYLKLPDHPFNRSSNIAVNNSLIYPSSKSLYPLARHIQQSQNTNRLALVPEALFEDFIINKKALDDYEVDNILILEYDYYKEENNGVNEQIDYSYKPRMLSIVDIRPPSGLRGGNILWGYHIE